MHHANPQRIHNPVRLLLLSFFAVALPLMNGCQKNTDAPARPAAVTVPATSTVALSDKELVFSLDGVWTTGKEDSWTYRIRATQSGDELQLMADEMLWDSRIDGIDPQKRTVALAVHERFGVIVDEVVTLQKSPGTNAADPGQLRLMYADGTAEELSFVRRLTPDDNAQLDKAAAEAVADGDAPVEAVRSNTVTVTLPGTEAYWQKHCASPANFVFRVVCKDPELKTQFDRLNEQLDGLEEIGYNASPDPDEAEVYAQRTAIEKQLNACAHSECIRSTLTQWITYMDENHAPDGEVAE